MAVEVNIPIALRRTRRGKLQASQVSKGSTSQTDASLPPSCFSNTKTPSRRGRPKKRVRFSDPYPTIERLSSPAAGSTGLTPMVNRTSLSTEPTKNRRHSSPAMHTRGRGSGLALDDPSPSLSNEITFLPLRQVLDGRVKRRIRRNRLSEEMNNIHTEKKKRAEKTKAEIDSLKAEVAAKDEEIQRLQEQNPDDTIIQDTGRIMDLERQIEELKNELANRSGVEGSTPHADRTYNWTMVARDPFASDYTMMDVNSDPIEADNEDDFGETTMAELQCSTPSRTTRSRGSFPTPPSTSPITMPMTPSSRFSTPRSHAGVQVQMSDPEKLRTEEELASLHLEICKITGTLESYQALTSRLAVHLEPFTPPTSSTPTTAAATSTSLGPNPEIEAHLAYLLQTLSDRTAVLLEISSSLSGLGFPGSDASDIVTSLSSAFRTARLELEYLTPGEIALPLTSAGAQVLDLLLDRLRDLSRKGKEADEQIDEYHELELSLRKQINARVEAMDGLMKELSRLDALSKGKDEKIADLEVGVDRLKGAVASYARDVGELEKLVQRMEGELGDKNTELETLRSGHGDLGNLLKSREETISDKNDAITELESKLTTAMEQTNAIRAELVAAQEQTAKAKDKHKNTIGTLNISHGQALALRDARVSELRGEIDRVNEALRTAHEMIRQLRVERSRLNTQLDEEKNNAKVAIESVKAELERVMKMSQDFVTTPKKPRRSSVGSSDGEGMPTTVLRSGRFLSGDLARRNSDAGGKSKKRRRYDSGLGFLDEDEIDVDA